MTTEEKAKAYDRALEKAKELYGKYCINNVLEILFLELIESEDERIRKGIIKFLIDVNNGAYTKSELEIASWIAWLEKQREQKWSDEDEIGSDTTIELLEYFINYAPEFRKPTIRRSIDWLKSLKKRMEE